MPQRHRVTEKIPLKIFDPYCLYVVLCVSESLWRTVQAIARATRSANSAVINTSRATKTARMI